MQLEKDSHQQPPDLHYHHSWVFPNLARVKPDLKNMQPIFDVPANAQVALFYLLNLSLEFKRPVMAILRQDPASRLKACESIAKELECLYHLVRIRARA